MTISAGQIVKEYLATRKVTITSLAEQLGVSIVYVHQMLNGKRKFNHKYIQEISKILSLTDEEIKAVLNTIRSEDSGLGFLIGHTEQLNFDETLVPFTRNCFSKVKGVGNIRVRSSKAINVVPSLNTTPWKGSIDLESKNFRFNLRIFVGVKNPGKVGLYWNQVRTSSWVPDKFLLEVSLDFDSIELGRLENQIKNSSSRFIKSSSNEQVQNVNVKES